MTLTPQAARRRRALLVAAAGSLLLSACGGAKARPGQVDVSRLPVYEGRDKQLFPDDFEPTALGLNVERRSFKNDMVFRDRVQQADAVGTVKVVTVTSSGAEGRPTYVLHFEVVGPAFGAKKALPGPDLLELTVVDGLPGYAAMQVVKSKIRGRTMIGMWRRYRQGEEAVSHWYFAPDDPETMAAARDALTLQELK